MIIFSSSVLLLPLLPPFAILLIGFIFPGEISWSLANGAITSGAIVGVVTCAYLLWHYRASFVFRVVCLVLVLCVMYLFSQFEFFTSQACVTQQGKFIDIQRQLKEIENAKNEHC